MKNMRIRFAFAVLAVVIIFTSSIPGEAASYRVKDMAGGTWAGAGGARWITFGRWNGRPIVWRILDVYTDSHGRKVALLLSEDYIDVQPYSISNKSGWSGSDLKAWLNKAFFNGAFHDSEKYCILYSKYSCSERYGEEDEFDSSRVFLLSAEEAQKKEYFADDRDRVLNGFQQTWWLRSSHDGSNSASCVFHNGVVISCDVELWKAVRPAMIINLLSLQEYKFLMAPLPQPEVIQAVTAEFIEELPIEGALIWEEKVLYAPRKGILTYKMQSPARVEKGDVLAELSSVEIRAEEPGYFVPFLDLNEGKYTYENLFLSGRLPLPQTEQPHIQYHGARLLDEPIGKLIPMPQPLRCVALIDKTEPLMEQVKSKFLNIRTLNTIWRAEIIKHIVVLDTKVKVYITLPFFPASALTSRSFSASVYIEKKEGVLLPASAITTKGGKQMGVLLTHGERKGFIEVEGFLSDDEHYFISEGLLPGDVVVLNADKEGYLFR